MKKILSILGLTTLMALNYAITQQTQTVMQEQDQIMIEIKEKKEQKKIEPIEGVIENNTIIPGLNGKEIDVNESYKQLKKIGKYNEKYLKYKEIKPEKTIENQYQKYIIKGNPEKNTISLIFLVKENDNINQIINILEKTNTKATFFIEYNWMKQHPEEIKKIKQLENTINPLNKNQNYQQKELLQKDTKYCYAEKENKENLKICSKQKHYTIKPNIIAQSLKQIKEKIEPGSLITIKTDKELELIINYIKTKGYNIEPLEQHLSEKNTN